MAPGDSQGLFSAWAAVRPFGRGARRFLRRAAAPGLPEAAEREEKLVQGLQFPPPPPEPSPAELPEPLLFALVLLERESERKIHPGGSQRALDELIKLLQEQDHFIPLKEELEFIDSYLDIESVRFGSGKLLVEKEVDEDALESYVPSMIIQPLVENAVKHGVGSRLEGGRIIIRAKRGLGSAVIEIEDNGMGIPKENTVNGLGIGLSNVNERLKVIYGSQYQLQLESDPERGTIARVEIPDVDVSYLRAS